MKSFSQVVNKKKHKRQFVVLWMFLIALELFCPVFCDEPTFAAQPDSPVSIVQILSENDESAAISDYQAAEDEKICNDECLCHATPIVGMACSVPEKSFFRNERIAFLTSNPYTNSLSPPHRPPKIS